jgi:hypothetical protein
LRSVWNFGPDLWSTSSNSGGKIQPAAGAIFNASNRG